MLKTRTVKIPVYILERRNMIFRAVYKLRKKMNKEPTAEQVAELSGASVFVVKKILEGTNNVYSLDRPIKTDEYKTFSALLSDKNSIAQDEFIAIRCVEKFINESLNCLDSKESNIIKMRYGLDNYERHTLDEIGKKYGVSRERIRQIEKEVFYKISHSKNGYILKSLL